MTYRHKPDAGQEVATASDDLTELVRAMGHDMRNSIRALRELPGWISADIDAQGAALPEDTSEHLRLITVHAKRVDKMVLDLLTYAKIGQSDDAVYVKVDAAVADALGKLTLSPLFVVTTDLQCASLAMKANDLSSILTELIRNAVKHHPLDRGHIAVSAKCIGEEAVITVCDDGAGVPDVSKQDIFAPMHTLHPRDEVEGSGMGLTIVRKLMSTYRGSIHVKDVPNGSGAMFEIRFPHGLTPSID